MMAATAIVASSANAVAQSVRHSGYLLRRTSTAASYLASPARQLSSSAVATSSRITLSHFVSAGGRPTTLLRPSRLTTTPSERHTIPWAHARSVVTMTRKPEQPEDPEVLAGGEEPSLLVTDRAISVSAKMSGR